MKKFYTWNQVETPPRGEFFEWIPTKNSEEEDPPWRTTPKIDLGFFGVRGFETTKPSLTSFWVPITSIPGGTFLTIKLSEKYKI